MAGMAFGRASLAVFTAFFMSAAACSDSDGDGMKTVYVNVGDVCVESSASGTVQVVVVFPTCLSSSCDRTLRTSCTVTESNGEISITSRGETESTGATECTDDCGALIARCESAPIEPGSYVVIYGDERVNVTLPHEKSAIISGNASFDACM
jgi:hypothetical protein